MSREFLLPQTIAAWVSVALKASVFRGEEVHRWKRSGLPEKQD